MEQAKSKSPAPDPAFLDEKVNPAVESRRNFLREGLAALAGTALGGTFVGMYSGLGKKGPNDETTRIASALRNIDSLPPEVLAKLNASITRTPEGDFCFVCQDPIESELRLALVSCTPDTESWDGERPEERLRGVNEGKNLSRISGPHTFIVAEANGESVAGVGAFSDQDIDWNFNPVPAEYAERNPNRDSVMLWNDTVTWNHANEATHGSERMNKDGVLVYIIDGLRKIPVPAMLIFDTREQRPRLVRVGTEKYPIMPNTGSEAQPAVIVRASDAHVIGFNSGFEFVPASQVLRENGSIREVWRNDHDDRGIDKHSFADVQLPKFEGDAQWPFNLTDSSGGQE